MKKLVRESLSEGKMSKEDVEKMKKRYETVQDEKYKIISHLRSKVFPKLDEDGLIDFMEDLRDWIDSMIGEKEKPSSDWKEAPPAPRGDMDPESWGDPPDWRPREMGG